MSQTSSSQDAAAAYILENFMGREACAHGCSSTVLLTVTCGWSMGSAVALDQVPHLHMSESSVTASKTAIFMQVRLQQHTWHWRSPRHAHAWHGASRGVHLLAMWPWERSRWAWLMRHSWTRRGRMLRWPAVHEQHFHSTVAFAQVS